MPNELDQVAEAFAQGFDAVHRLLEVVDGVGGALTVDFRARSAIPRAVRTSGSDACPIVVGDRV